MSDSFLVVIVPESAQLESVRLVLPLYYPLVVYQTVELYERELKGVREGKLADWCICNSTKAFGPKKEKSDRKREW